MLFAADSLLFLSLVLAPLLYGSVHFFSLLLLAFLSLVIFNLVLAARPSSLGPALRSPWVWAGLFILGVALLQLIPWPAGVVRAVSPGLYHFYAQYQPETLARGMPFSVYPSDTVRGIIQLLAYGLFFAAILMRLEPGPLARETVHPASLQKSEYLKLGCLAGVLSLLFHSIYDFNLHVPANGIYFVVLLALGAGTAGRAYDHAFFRRLVEFVIVFGFLIALLSIIQKFSHNGHILWVGIPAPHPVGPYFNYDHYAGFMELCSALAIAMGVAGVLHTSFFQRRGFIRKAAWFATKEANKTLRYLVMAAVMAATIFMSTSRGGIMSFVLSQIIFFALVMWAAGRARKSRRLLGILATVVLFIGVMVLWLGPEPFLERFRLTSIEKIIKMEGYDAYRLRFYQGAARVISDFPLTGTGLNTFGTNFTRYRSFDFRGTMDYLRFTHNDYLQLVSETGAGGMIFLFGFMAFYIRALVLVARKLE